MIYRINIFIWFQREIGQALIEINHDVNIYSLDFDKEKTYFFDFRDK